MTKPRKPGRNIAENERSTRRVVLRLPPEIAARLRATAARRAMTVSGLVASFLGYVPIVADKDN